MADRRIEVAVDVPADLCLGKFVNAFRVLSDGGDMLIDFVLYSEHAHAAEIVTRIRVHPSFLVDMRDRLNVSIQELQAQAAQMAAAQGTETVLVPLSIDPDKVN